MKTQKHLITESKGSFACASALFGLCLASTCSATITSYGTLGSAVAAKSDTLIAGAGVTLLNTDTTYLSAVGGAPNYNLSGAQNHGGVGVPSGVVSPAPFTFSYDPNVGSGTFYFTLGLTGGGLASHTAAATPAQLALIASGMGGFYFEIDKPLAGSTASLTGLRLYTGADKADELFLGNAGADSFALGATTTGTAYMTSPLLENGFYLEGMFNYSSESGKSGFRVFVGSTPVPEASTIAFGSLLIGGLAVAEVRRRKAKLLAV